MLTGNELYVVVKLSTGEQVMGVLQLEDENYIQLYSPMVLRTVPIFNEGREHITANPYCQFTEDLEFNFHKKDILFIKPLARLMIPNYIRIVNENEERPMIRQEPPKPKLDWGDAETMTPEEARKRIEMLMDFTEKAEEREKELLTNFIEGNDTKH